MYRFVSRLNIVLLPAPFGPIRAVSEPARTPNETSANRVHAAERLRDRIRPTRASLVVAFIDQTCLSGKRGRAPQASAETPVARLTSDVKPP